MSKLNIKISYKDACILTHSVRDKIKINQEVLNVVEVAIKGLDENQYTVDAYKKQKKELSEEEAALERFKEQINQCGIKHGRNVFKEV